MEEGEVARRKRRTKHRRKELTRLQLFLRGRGLTYSIFAFMVLVSAIYGYVVAGPLFVARQKLGLVHIGMAQSEVLYVLGKPTAQSADNQTWTYSNQGRIEEYRFDPVGKVEVIACSVPQQSVEMCPATMGLGVGSSEEAITRRLGPADRATYAGTLKRLNYDGVGLEFDIVHGEAKSVRLAKTEDASGMFRQTVWTLLP